MNTNFKHNGVLYVAKVEFGAYNRSGNSKLQIFFTEQPNCSIRNKTSRRNRRTGEVITNYVDTRMAISSGRVGVLQPRGDVMQFLKGMADSTFDGKNPATEDLWGVTGMPFFNVRITNVEYKGVKNPVNNDKVYAVEFCDWDDDTIMKMEDGFDRAHPGFISNLDEQYLSNPSKSTFIQRWENFTNAVQQNVESRRNSRISNDLMSNVAKTIISEDEFALLKKKTSAEIKKFCVNSQIPFQGNKAKTIQHIYTNYVKPYKV